MRYGYLLGCFEAEGNRYCLVQPILPVCERGGIHAKNEFDCPIYKLSFSVTVISSSLISSPVSFVHQCQSSCSLTDKRVSVLAEGEHFLTSKFVFVHNYTNRHFCINIFCMNQ